MTILKGSLALVAVLYLAVVLAMFILQRSLQYFPTHRAPAPGAVGLTDVQALNLETPDGVTITLWYAPAPAGQPTILFFHGNAGEMADRADRFAFWQAQGYGVLYLSPRGYGGSTGSITEDGLIIDAVAAHDWLTAQGVAAARIIAIGESLGTGLVVRLASRRTLGALILEAPYSSTVDVAQRLYPWLPVRLLMRDRFESINYIAQNRAPLLIQHGTDDRVIPFDLGQRLFDAAGGPKTFVALPGQGHEALYTRALWQTEAEFIARHFPR